MIKRMGLGCFMDWMDSDLKEIGKMIRRMDKE
jgi:hypothetical protein